MRNQKQGIITGFEKLNFEEYQFRNFAVFERIPDLDLEAIKVQTNIYKNFSDIAHLYVRSAVGGTLSIFTIQKHFADLFHSLLIQMSLMGIKADFKFRELKYPEKLSTKQIAAAIIGGLVPAYMGISVQPSKNNFYELFNALRGLVFHAGLDFEFILNLVNEEFEKLAEIKVEEKEEEFDDLFSHTKKQKVEENIVEEELPVSNESFIPFTNNVVTD